MCVLFQVSVPRHQYSMLGIQDRPEEKFLRGLSNAIKCECHFCLVTLFDSLVCLFPYVWLFQVLNLTRASKSSVQYLSNPC
jgi:hypothetical protein